MWYGGRASLSNRPVSVWSRSDSEGSVISLDELQEDIGNEEVFLPSETVLVEFRFEPDTKEADAEAMLAGALGAKLVTTVARYAPSALAECPARCRDILCLGPVALAPGSAPVDVGARLVEIQKVQPTKQVLVGVPPTLNPKGIPAFLCRVYSLPKASFSTARRVQQMAQVEVEMPAGTAPLPDIRRFKITKGSTERQGSLRAYNRQHPRMPLPLLAVPKQPPNDKAAKEAAQRAGAARDRWRRGCCPKGHHRTKRRCRTGNRRDNRRGCTGRQPAGASGEPQQPPSNAVLREVVLAASPRSRFTTLVRYASDKTRKYLSSSTDLTSLEGMTEAELKKYLQTLPMRVGSAESRAGKPKQKKPKPNTP
ncbi:hypothetical protein TSOC_004835 [Tetrabaena socialis]|uniref:Uncharacterized protein n=1 Tax=Tetrabaena socialis TaxID=47790 RepID=A0A2J8A7S2_9CHLO|nr:hypothetical protein TSOC_004835 [Tetrabaena socialis]|eukprot:PNH08577.1 hypothetical protein TSOC_004835 [Tetrabaena socialis]